MSVLHTGPKLLKNPLIVLEIFFVSELNDDLAAAAKVFDSEV